MILLFLLVRPVPRKNVGDAFRRTVFVRQGSGDGVSVSLSQHPYFTMHFCGDGVVCPL